MSNKTDPNGRGNQLKGIAQPSMDMTAKGVKIKVSSVHSKSNQPAIVGTNLGVMSIRKRKKNPSNQSAGFLITLNVPIV